MPKYSENGTQEHVIFLLPIVNVDQALWLLCSLRFLTSTVVSFCSKDVASKSDPFLICFAGETVGKNGKDMDQVCITETIYDTHSCKWVQKVVLQETDNRVFKFDVSAAA